MSKVASKTVATPTYLSIGDGIISNLNSILPFVNNSLSKLNVPAMKTIPLIHRNPIIMDSFLKTTNKYFYDNGPVLVSELNKLLKTYLSSMISSIQANEDQSIYDEYAGEAVAQPTMKTVTPKRIYDEYTGEAVAQPTMKTVTPKRIYDEYADEAVAQPTMKTVTKTVTKIPTTLRGGSKRSTRKLDMKKRR